MIGAPPFAGSVQLRVADRTPAAAITFVGALGTVAGVTVVEAADAAPVPTALTAATVNVYAVPLMRPETVAIRALPTVTAVPAAAPTWGVTMYPVIALLPFDAGALQVTVTWLFPMLPATLMGAPGTSGNVIDADATDAALVPAAFVAVTCNV
jgi:hypothetical protein